MTDLYRDLADLYDLVFDWDVEDEAAWLALRLGPECRRVLEPGCGAGRMFVPLERHGLSVVGIDRSPAMVDLARSRGNARVALADIVDFDLGEVFDGAVCPINTLGHLSRAELGTHLSAMARALVPGARYLVQLALDADMSHASRWEVERDGVHVRASWVVESRDTERGVERHRSTFEVVAGPRAGEVHEQVHEMTYWTPETWGETIAASAFDWAAVYDGIAAGHPRRDFTATGGLLWHELVRA